MDAGKPVAGLNADRPAYRTFIFTQGPDHFGLGISESVSLAELAQILATPDLVPGGKITRALNLDGGSSTGLYVNGSSQHVAIDSYVRLPLVVIVKER